MGLLAGFDLVVEASQPFLCDFLQKSGFPIDTTIPISSPPFKGSGHVNADNPSVSLESDDLVRLSAHFFDSSIDLSMPIALTLAPLEGTITVEVGGPGKDPGITLVEGTTPDQKALALNLESPFVTISFTSDAATVINNAFEGFEPFAPNADDVASGLAGIVANALQNDTPVALPVQFHVTPGTDGTLIPSLRFEHLEVHCIPHPSDLTRQALGLFGGLMLSSHGAGDASTKTESAIPAGRDACASLSPEAFNAYVFCPGAKQLLGGSDDLPPSCGASEVPFGDGVIEELSNEPTTGGVSLNISFKRSSSCPNGIGLDDASGNLTGLLNFTPAGTSSSPDVSIGLPSIVVNSSCHDAEVLAEFISLALADAMNALAAQVGSKFNEALTAALALAPSFEVSIAEVSIVPEGLTVAGDVLIP